MVVESKDGWSHIRIARIINRLGETNGNKRIFR